MADVKFLANIDLNDNQLLNMKLQHLSSDPTGVEGQLFYHSGSNVVKFYDGSNWIAFGTSTADGDITGVAAGSGMTGGGASGGVTLNVIGGNGITANADNVAITAAQTTITSVLNTGLVLGRDADNQIKFATDNTMVFRVGAGDGVTFKASGEIEATKFDGALEGNADTATTLATARNIGGVSFNGSANINLPGVNTAGNQNTSGTAAAATLAAASTTVTVADESSDTTCFPLFSTAATGNLGAKSGTNLTFNSSSGMLAATGVTSTFTGDITGDVTGDVSGSSGSCTGLAATATALASARTIGGVSFNGTANINLPGVNGAGNQNTSGNAATATKLATARAFTTSGDVVVASTNFDGSGNFTAAATIQANAVEASMLNTNIISGLTDIGAAIASTDEFLISDNGTIRRTDASRLTTFLQSALTFTTNTNTGADLSQANLKTKIGGAFNSNALAIGDSNATITVPGDFVVDGAITLKGATVLESTTNTAIKDKILLLNQGATGANSNDLGILWSRGSGTTGGEANVAFKWDEGDLNFELIATTAAGNEANGAMDVIAVGESGQAAGVRGHQNLKLSKLTLEAFVLDGNTITGVDDSGEFTDDDGHIMTSAGINDRFAQINANTTGSSGSCSGLAATATALATARTIGGVSFNGTANINLPGVNSAGNQNTSGSAATLTTARTIGGVSFNGGANINLPGVNSAGNQNTTGSAATLTTSRNINGVAFNGSANITVTAAAGTLSGSTLKSSVTASSLTSVGTLTSGNATAIVTAASASAAGKVELATTAEALAGTDTSRAVTAAGLAARSFKATIGDGSDVDIAVTHNLGTRDVVVQLYDASDYKTIFAEVVRTDANTVTINTNTAIATNDCIVLITKID